VNLSIINENQITIVKPVGRLDAHEAAGFRQTVSPLFDSPNIVHVDMSSVVFIDSTALAELVRLSRLAEGIGGTLVLRDPSVPVKVILELTGLDLVLQVENHAVGGPQTT
jgi:anti-sigma B factor antagonist